MPIFQRAKDGFGVWTISTKEEVDVTEYWEHTAPSQQLRELHKAWVTVPPEHDAIFVVDWLLHNILRKEVAWSGHSLEL
jgi:hypothetical protein